jgi:hypothetical protein
VAHSVDEIDQLIVEGPIRDVLGNKQAKGKVGRLAGLERRSDLLRHLLLLLEDKLDLLAGVLLEDGNDLANRLVLLGVAYLSPFTSLTR